ITFSATGLTAVTTSVTPTLGAGSRLVMNVNAAGAVSGSAFTTQPKVLVQDSGGNTVTSSTATITATVSAGGTLIGTTTATPSSGIGTYTNLGLTAAAGTYTITYSATGLTSITQSITVTSPTPAPTISSVSPNSGATSGGVSVTITGANFTGATAVTFGGTPGTSVVIASGTTITVTTPARTQGAVAVAVTTPGGTASLANGFTYLTPGTPLGAGIYLAATTPPAGTRTPPWVSAQPTSSRSRVVTTPLNTPTRLQLASLPKSSRVQAQIRINGNWRGMGVYRSTSKGRVTLRALTATVPGTYYVRLKVGKKTFFVRLQGG
ncbi:MAG: IPT/TIG domain-containing protein, partial [Actinomycetales bacterium]